jgi:predicted amidohydrolase YtcJ
VAAGFGDNQTFSRDAYALHGHPSTSGQIDFPPEEMQAILEEAQQRNRQLLLHAVGDRTIDTFLSLLRRLVVATFGRSSICGSKTEAA